jgi:hypothetical protein
MDGHAVAFEQLHRAARVVGHNKQPSASLARDGWLRSNRCFASSVDPESKDQS